MRGVDVFLGGGSNKNSGGKNRKYANPRVEPRACGWSTNLFSNCMAQGLKVPTPWIKCWSAVRRLIHPPKKKLSNKQILTATQTSHNHTVTHKKDDSKLKRSWGCPVIDCFFWVNYLSGFHYCLICQKLFCCSVIRGCPVEKCSKTQQQTKLRNKYRREQQMPKKNHIYIYIKIEIQNKKKPKHYSKLKKNKKQQKAKHQ